MEVWAVISLRPATLSLTCNLSDRSKGALKVALRYAQLNPDQLYILPYDAILSI